MTNSVRDSSEELSATPSPSAGQTWLHEAVATGEDGRVSTPPFDVDIPHPGCEVDGKYRLGALIGRGGMGWVFEATHLRTEKCVALKYLRPSLLRSRSCVYQFAREARAAGRIDHPNVIRIYDVGGSEARPYIVMERLRGETLRTRMRRQRLSAREAAQIMLRTMRGMAEAHRLGVVHGDIKPENIFLSVLPDGTPDEPKVLDFGVSQLAESLLANSGLPIGGTPGYMSIEQLRGESVDVRSDIHASAVVLYEAIAGRLPWASTDRSGLAVEMRLRPVPQVHLDDEMLSRRLNAVLARALAAEREECFASMGDLAAALQIAVEAATSDVVASVPERRLRSLRRGLVVAALCSAGALVLSPDDRGGHVRSDRGAAFDLVPARQMIGETTATLAPTPFAAYESQGAAGVPVESSTVASHASRRPGRGGGSANSARVVSKRDLRLSRSDF